MRLAAKTAFITAAGNGIGRAAALAFAAEGARVVAAWPEALVDAEEAWLRRALVLDHHRDVLERLRELRWELFERSLDLILELHQ